ncbi:MAG: hypothetical protein GY830_05100 [Bacteroidetes bacterium]|nr:hypothetical protein [Bacteroidota bacterium]
MNNIKTVKYKISKGLFALFMVFAAANLMIACGKNKPAGTSKPTGTSNPKVTKEMVQATIATNKVLGIDTDSSELNGSTLEETNKLQQAKQDTELNKIKDWLNIGGRSNTVAQGIFPQLKENDGEVTKDELTKLDDTKLGKIVAAKKKPESKLEDTQKSAYDTFSDTWTQLLETPPNALIKLALKEDALKAIIKTNGDLTPFSEMNEDFNYETATSRLLELQTQISEESSTVLNANQISVLNSKYMSRISLEKKIAYNDANKDVKQIFNSVKDNDAIQEIENALNHLNYAAVKNAITYNDNGLYDIMLDEYNSNLKFKVIDGDFVNKTLKMGRGLIVSHIDNIKSFYLQNKVNEGHFSIVKKQLQSLIDNVVAPINKNENISETELEEFYKLKHEIIEVHLDKNSIYKYFESSLLGRTAEKIGFHKPGMMLNSDIDILQKEGKYKGNYEKAKEEEKTRISTKSDVQEVGLLPLIYYAVSDPVNKKDDSTKQTLSEGKLTEVKENLKKAFDRVTEVRNVLKKYYDTHIESIKVMDQAELITTAITDMNTLYEELCKTVDDLNEHDELYSYVNVKLLTNAVTTSWLQRDPVYFRIIKTEGYESSTPQITSLKDVFSEFTDKLNEMENELILLENYNRLGTEKAKLTKETAKTEFPYTPTGDENA